MRGRGERPRKGCIELVESLSALRQERAWFGQFRTDERARQPELQSLETALGGAPAALERVKRAPAQFARFEPDDFRGSARRFDVRVGSEIAQLLVGRVADRREHGMACARDRADDRLIAKREQILERTAATGDDDEIDVRCGGAPQRGADRLRRGRTLNEGLAPHDPHVRRAFVQNRHEVDGTARAARRNERYPKRKAR